MDNIKTRIQELQQSLDKTDDFSERLDLSGEIHRLKMQLEGIEPQSGEVECVGCGS